MLGQIIYKRGWEDGSVGKVPVSPGMKTLERESHAERCIPVNTVLRRQTDTGQFLVSACQPV